MVNMESAPFLDACQILRAKEVVRKYERPKNIRSVIATFIRESVIYFQEKMNLVGTDNTYKSLSPVS